MPGDIHEIKAPAFISVHTRAYSPQMLHWVRRVMVDLINPFLHKQRPYPRSSIDLCLRSCLLPIHSLICHSAVGWRYNFPCIRHHWPRRARVEIKWIVGDGSILLYCELEMHRTIYTKAYADLSCRQHMGNKKSRQHV